MVKWRNFYLMKIYDSKKKYIGVVDDISIDFYNGVVKGFTISPVSIFKKHTYVSVDSIISVDESMQIKNTCRFEGLKFKDIKYMDIINSEKRLIGVLEDLIIDEKTFEIKGVIISSGIFDKMFKGKEVITLKHCSLCDEYIMYNGNSTVKLKTLPHNLGGNADAQKV